MTPRTKPSGALVPGTWTSSAKDLVSTALGSSRIWATFGFGIVNEAYWPSTGEPQLRDRLHHHESEGVDGGLLTTHYLDDYAGGFGTCRVTCMKATADLRLNTCRIRCATAW